jgi:hypothetical protein
MPLSLLADQLPGDSTRAGSKRLNGFLAGAGWHLVATTLEEQVLLHCVRELGKKAEDG